MEKWIKTYPKIFSKQECAGFVEYFNDQIMDGLEEAAKKEFLYGEVDQDVPEDIQ